MVSKLKLDKASKDNPKYIEVLLPYTAVDEKGNANDFSRSPKRRSVVSGRDRAPTIRRALWKALQAPWTANPRKTIGKPWPTMPLRKAPLRKCLTSVGKNRLGQSTLTRIDGIITMNDYIASEVVKELDNLGYTGSAADINPQITISGIVGITGKKDLSRDAVPDPMDIP